MNDSTAVYRDTMHGFRRRWVRPFRSLTWIALLLCSVGCSGEEDAPLRWEKVHEGQQAGVLVENVPVGARRIVGSVVLCHDSTSSAKGLLEISNVRAAESDKGVRVTDFTVRPHVAAYARGALMVGAQPGPLEKLGIRRAARVTQPCTTLPGAPASRPDSVEELLVEVTKEITGNARTEGLVVEYRSENAPRDLAVPVTVLLCGGRAHGLVSCE